MEKEVGSGSPICDIKPVSNRRAERGDRKTKWESRTQKKKPQLEKQGRTATRGYLRNAADTVKIDKRVKAPCLRNNRRPAAGMRRKGLRKVAILQAEGAREHRVSGCPKKSLMEYLFYMLPGGGDWERCFRG